MNRHNFMKLAVVLILTGCSAAPALFVSNIKDTDIQESNHYLYSLPRTVVNIDFGIQKSVFVPGPYHDYATKYLAIEDVGHIEAESWHIRKIKMYASVEPDPDYFYAASADADISRFNKALEMLSQSGQIILPGDYFINGPVSAELEIPEEHIILFKDLSVKRNLKVKKETSYRRVFRDSVYIQVPVETEHLVEKEPEQKAKEAADFIIKLRKRRFKLLTGQNEGDIPDATIDAVIDELNRTEQEYLELFTGKTVIKSETSHFEYLPVAERLTDQKILFKLSGPEGILDAMSSKGKPVIFGIECLNITQDLRAIHPPEIGNLLYYRQPDLARIVISLDGKQLFEGKLTVYQYGSVVCKKVTDR